MKRIALLLIVLLAAMSAAAEVKLLRHPSYHNGKVAFSYLGDIWTANEDGSNIQRLTVHTARDIYPRFSPDGKWIAFSSNRYGNNDVFVIPATGGAARQLTFNSSPDNVVGWTPDSRQVIFSSARGLLYPGVANLYQVAVDGGLEQPMPTDWGYSGSFSPDGSKFAFNRHPAVWSRQHYRGSYAADLWLMDVKAQKYTHIADEQYKGNYFWPMYAAGGDIYFVSDRLPNEPVKPGSAEVMKSVNNIWKISANGGKPVQVTHHTDGRLYFPSISADGKIIVYEENFGLWKLDTASGKTQEIKINIASDDKENEIETVTVRGETEGYDLSPSSRRAAVSAHGEIFTVATERGDIQRVTESFARDSNPTWSPDGKWIAFVSDQSGQDEVWIAHENGTGPKKLTEGGITEKRAIVWAPDSKSFLYTASDHKLYRLDTETGKAAVIVKGEAGDIVTPRFSPDAKWIAYSTLDGLLRPHVYIMPAAGGDAHHVGSEDDMFAVTGPVWTPDGKHLLFLAGVTQQGSATLARPNNIQLYSVSLQKEEKSPTDRGIDDEEEAQAAERQNRGRPGAGAAGGGPPPAPEVKIDFEGILRRSRQVTRNVGNVASVAVSPDSRTYAFVATATEGGASIYTIQDDGSQLSRIVQAAPAGGGGEETPPPGGGFGRGFYSNLKFSRDGRTLYFLEGSALNAVDIGGGGGGGGGAPAAAAAGGPGGRGAAAGAAAVTSAPRTPRRINFTVRVDVDHHQERAEVFNEGWRIMKNRFYDANMHGADWNKAKVTYEPMLQYVADQDQLHDLMMTMIGEINSSHTGVSAGGPGGGPGGEAGDRIQTRYPGFEMKPDDSGYYRVSYVYHDGPADKDYVHLSVGDYILAIDGHPLKSGDNYWKYLNALRGQKFEFTANSKPTAEGAWRTKVEPVSAQQYGTEQYEKWVTDRRAMVDKLSGGEIAYVHIRSMDEPSLRRFQKEFAQYHDKKALIIDQRFNPGGGIDQELLEILGQHQYQKTRGRDSVFITRPQQGFFGPMVVMENERSTSDAEVFPDGFRTLGLGKVVGVTTYGAVIGTGSYRLLDGSTIRTPGTGLYNVKGYNLENYGVPPDVYIDNTPADFIAGRDAQLEKAVEVLKQDLQQQRRPAAMSSGQGQGH